MYVHSTYIESSLNNSSIFLIKYYFWSTYELLLNTAAHCTLNFRLLGKKMHLVLNK